MINKKVLIIFILCILIMPNIIIANDKEYNISDDFYTKIDDILGSADKVYVSYDYLESLKPIDPDKIGTKTASLPAFYMYREDEYNRQVATYTGGFKDRWGEVKSQIKVVDRHGNPQKLPVFRQDLDNSFRDCTEEGIEKLIKEMPKEIAMNILEKGIEEIMKELGFKLDPRLGTILTAADVLDRVCEYGSCIFDEDRYIQVGDTNEQGIFETWLPAGSILTYLSREVSMNPPPLTSPYIERIDDFPQRGKKTFYTPSHPSSLTSIEIKTYPYVKIATFSNNYNTGDFEVREDLDNYLENTYGVIDIDHVSFRDKDYVFHLASAWDNQHRYELPSLWGVSGHNYNLDTFSPTLKNIEGDWVIVKDGVIYDKPGTGIVSVIAGPQYSLTGKSSVIYLVAGMDENGLRDAYQALKNGQENIIVGDTSQKTLSLPGTVKGYTRGGKDWHTTMNVPSNIKNLELKLDWSNIYDWNFEVTDGSGRTYTKNTPNSKYFNFYGGHPKIMRFYNLSSSQKGNWNVKVYPPGYAAFSKFTLTSKILPGGVNFKEAGESLSGLDLEYISMCAENGEGIKFVIKGEKADPGEQVIDPEAEGNQILEDFKVGLAIPNSKQWISLPLHDVEIEPIFAEVEVSRVMLEADVEMKFSDKSVLHDMVVNIYEKWDELLSQSPYQEVRDLQGRYPGWVFRTAIIPGSIFANATNCEVHIVNATLGVDSELMESHFDASLSPDAQEDLNNRLDMWRDYFTDKLWSDHVPAVKKAVNEEDEFREVRQSYKTLALAQWYKKLDRTKIPLGKFIDSENITGLEADDPFDHDYWADQSYHFIIDVPEYGTSVWGGVVLGWSFINETGELENDTKELIKNAIIESHIKDGDDHYFGGLIDSELPDLAPISVWFPGYVLRDNEKVNIGLAIENQGSSDSGDFYVRFYDLYTHFDNHTSIYPLGEVFVTGIDSGEIKEISFEWDPKGRLGTNIIIAEVDVKNDIEESVESNNFQSREVFIFTPYPNATIYSPENGFVYTYGENIIFVGSGYDMVEGELSGSSLVWESNIDGIIGIGKTFNKSDLSHGTHSISLTVTDSEGLTDTNYVSVQIKPAEPRVNISSPSHRDKFEKGETITFEGHATDAEDGNLTGPSLIWTSSRDGEIGTGESFTRSDLSPGTHLITLTATDSDGLTSNDRVLILVVSSQSVIDEGKELAGNIVFDRKESKTRYVKIPKGASILSAILDITGKCYNNCSIHTFTEIFKDLVYIDTTKTKDIVFDTNKGEISINNSIFKFNGNDLDAAFRWHWNAQEEDGIVKFSRGNGFKIITSRGSNGDFKYVIKTRVLNPGDPCDNKVSFETSTESYEIHNWIYRDILVGWQDGYQCGWRNYFIISYADKNGQVWTWYQPWNRWVPYYWLSRVRFTPGQWYYVEFERKNNLYYIRIKNSGGGIVLAPTPIPAQNLGNPDARFEFWGIAWRVSTGDFDDFDDGYRRYAVVQSEKFGEIMAARASLYTDQTTPPKTRFKYQLSGNNGNSWNICFPGGGTCIIVPPGEDLKWKAHVFTSSNTVTPTLREVIINYSGPFPTNPKMDVGGDGDFEWWMSGELMKTITVHDFSRELQEHVNICSTVEDNKCKIPIKFHSDTAGEMDISNVFIQYTFIDSSPPTLFGTVRPNPARPSDDLLVYTKAEDNVEVSKVNASLLDSWIDLTYNESSGYYEGRMTAPPKIGEYMIDVTATDVSNLTTTISMLLQVKSIKPDLTVYEKDIFILNDTLVDGSNTSIKVIIYNFGENDANDFDVDLLIDGEKKNSATISITGENQTRVEFDFIAEYGNSTLKIVVDSSDVIDEEDETNNEAEMNIFVLDLTPPPAPEPRANPENWTTDDTPTISWDAVEDSTGIDRYEYMIDYGAWTSVGTQLSFDTPPQLTGIHRVYVRAVDGAGNVGPAGYVDIFVDTLDPNTPRVYEWHSGGSWTNHDSPYFAWVNPGDVGSGVDYYVANMDNGSEFEIHDEFYHPTLDTGIHSFEIYAVDKVAHESDWSNKVTVYIDTIEPQPPVISSPTHPDQNKWYSNNIVFLNWTPPYDDSGIYSYYYFLDKKQSSIPNIMSRWTSRNYVNITNTGGGMSGPSNETGLSDGQWYFHITSKDRAGNIGTNASHYGIKIDNSPPYTSINLSGTLGNEGWYISDVEVNLDGYDQYSGVNFSEYNFDCSDNYVKYTSPFLITQEGENVTLCYRSVDFVGNVEEPKSISLKIDKTTPESVLYTNWPLYYNGSDYFANITTEYAINASDNLSGLYKIEIDIDGSGFVNYTGPFYFTSEGVYNIKYRAIDIAGNIEETNVFEVNVDDTAPDTSFLYGAPRYLSGSDVFITSATPLVLFAEEDGLVRAGINYSAYNVDSTGWVIKDKFIIDNLGWVTETYFNLQGFGEGYHTIEFYSMDYVYNKEEIDSAVVIVDDTPPTTTLTIGNPKYDNGTHVFVKSETNFTLNAVDGGKVPSGVQYTQYRIDSGTWINGTIFNLAGFVDGWHVIDYRSIDNVENTEDYSSVTVGLDNTPPEIVIYSPEARKYFTIEDITINFVVTDDMSGVKSYEAYLDNVSVNNGDVIDLAVLGIGNHTFVVIAYDNLDNMASESVVFEVAKTEVWLNVTPIAKNKKEDHGFDFMVHVKNNDFDLTELTYTDPSTVEFTESYYETEAILGGGHQINLKVDVGQIEERPYIFNITKIGEVELLSLNQPVREPFFPGKP